MGKFARLRGGGAFRPHPPGGPARCAGLRRAVRAALRSFVVQAGPDPARLPARLFRFAKVEPCSRSCWAQLSPLFVQRPLAAGARGGVAHDPCAPPPHGPSREALCSGLRADALAWRAPRATCPPLRASSPGEGAAATPPRPTHLSFHRHSLPHSIVRAGPLRRPAEPQKPRSFGAPASRNAKSESRTERSPSSTERSTARSNEPGRDRARFICRERNNRASSSCRAGRSS